MDRKLFVLLNLSEGFFTFNQTDHNRQLSVYVPVGNLPSAAKMISKFYHDKERHLISYFA